MKNNKLLSYLRKRKEQWARHVEYRRLKRIRRKKTPSYSYCKNCGAKLDGMYCYQCGQYALDIEQPFWKYIRQYFENVYQFDGKVWMTLYLLFRKPGFLTNEFNAGKVSSYVHPLRLFMFISAVFFLCFFALVPDDPNSMGITMTNGDGRFTYVQTEYGTMNIPMAQDAYDYWYDELSDEERLAAPDTTVWICNKEEAEAGLKTIARWKESPYQDTLRGKVPKVLLEQHYLLPIHLHDTVYALSSDTTYFKTIADEVEALKVENTMNWGAFTSWYSSWLPIILLLLIPVFALLLKLFFRNEKIPYMKHYAFALHLHSVMLLAVSVVLLWFYFVSTDFANEIAQCMSVLLLLYLIIAAHRVYTHSNWLVGTLKSVVLYFIYMVILFTVFILTLLWVATTIFGVNIGEYF